MSIKHGYYLEDLKAGMNASLERVISEADVRRFADLSGDHNPIHLDSEYAAETIFKRPIAHGMLSASLLTNLAGNQLPGFGTIYVSQTFNFLGPVYIGDAVKAQITVKTIEPEKRKVTLTTELFVGKKVVLTGEAVVLVDRRP